MKPVKAEQAAIQLAADLLRQGRLVAFPTETVYGLGADAKNPEAVRRIFAAKGRPFEHPLIVHLPNVAALDEWATEIPDYARKLADRFWPGPLTMVLNKRPDVPNEVTGGQSTIALRVPAHPVALSLLQEFGVGIAAPSANRFCRISPTQASHVLEELGDAVDMILDGGACQVGLESTIVDLSAGQPTLLRPGQISRLDIEEILGTELLLPQYFNVRAPGMMDVHYAPDVTTLFCSAEQIHSILEGNVFENNFGIGVLTYHAEFERSLAKQVIVMPKEVSEYAHCLYGNLRELDDNPDIDIILVEQPPQTDEWLAVSDRLSKATRMLSAMHNTKIIPRCGNKNV